MDKILKVTVVYEAHVFDLGECDADHISLINLVHAMTKEVTDSSELPSRGFTVRAELPWSRDTIIILTDSELLYVFKEFGNRGYDEICFQIEKTPHSPIDESEVVEQIGWCNEEAGMFDFTVDSEGEDTESDDAKFEEGVESDGDAGEGVNNGVGVGLDGMEDEGVENGEDVHNEGVDNGEDVQNEGVLNGEDVHAGKGLNGDVVDEDEITKQCMALFDGYESRSDDDYFTDHDKESSNQKKTRISLGNMSEGQTFGSNEKMRDIFREYAIREDDKHDCHRVYNNSEAKVKWIASRVEFLVKSNSTVGAKVLGDLILERFGYDQFIRCDHVTNNMTEAFNSMLGTHRAQTNLLLLEFIRRMVMRKLQEMMEECEAWRDVLPSRVNARILKNSQTSRQLTIISVGDQEYELLGSDGTFPVKLKE
ncbi:hypothetical protein Ddye_006490 [Dipteronia dyeriana]|uniref:Transposase MuDR plant domain-containing protein n=1 Tax=Dipteronia dyeriana TaxID=168575 RepID=A0AAD9XIS2_9ROSI|nr:hypothetical protein Ddye_006490 [Dipteronia dyeriana]